jgi:hypothetical protein
MPLLLFVERRPSRPAKVDESHTSPCGFGGTCLRGAASKSLLGWEHGAFRPQHQVQSTIGIRPTGTAEFKIDVRAVISMAEQRVGEEKTTPGPRNYVALIGHARLANSRAKSQLWGFAG